MGTETSSMDITEPLIHQDPQNTNNEKNEFLSEPVPEWKEQITIRGLVVSAVLGCLFCIITHKLNLTVGIIPSLNVAAGLLGFFFVKTWTGLLTKIGIFTKPFTRQENTVIQTCVVACYGLAFSGKNSLLFDSKVVCFLYFFGFDWFVFFLWMHVCDLTKNGSSRLGWFHGAASCRSLENENDLQFAAS
jgi:hypothetical protein